MKASVLLDWCHTETRTEESVGTCTNRKEIRKKTLSQVALHKPVDYRLKKIGLS